MLVQDYETWRKILSKDEKDRHSGHYFFFLFKVLELWQAEVERKG